LVFADASGPVIDTPDRYFDENAKTVTGSEDKARAVVRARKTLYEGILGRPVRKVLEIGCGDGAWARAWLEEGCEYTGIEYLPKVAEDTRRRTGANILSGDFVDINNIGPFDVGFCSQVLEHVTSAIPFLRRAGEICSMVHIDVPNHDSLVSAVRKAVHPRQYGFIQPPHHLRAYNVASLSRAMNLAGLKVERCKPMRNDDPVLGQVHGHVTPANRIVYALGDMFKAGSLLVGIGSPA
jgi:SAM-dependent methyltransferase